MGKQATSNYILQAKSDQFYWEGHGQLSIKTFRHGQAQYKGQHGFFTVEETRYLLLNEGPYTLAIEQEQEIESFCLFFQRGLAEEVYRSMTTAAHQLLTDPVPQTGTPIEFFEKTYPQHQQLSMAIDRLKINQELYLSDPLWKEEQFYSIMHILLAIHQDTLAKAHALDAQRTATREELFRRLSIAQDYIRSFYHQSITLEQIANVSALSPNHLLRSYTAAFGYTPYQQITALRLEKAKQLLQNFNYNMLEIGLEIGFSSPAAFSKWFKKQLGLAPLQYRKKVLLDKK